MNKRNFILKNLTLLGFLAIVSCFAVEPRIPGIIAHRGVVLEAPENTLPAIIGAVEARATLGEISDRLRAVWGEHREVVTV